MKENVLQEIGFSKSESKVYLELLRLGKTKSGRIIKVSGLQSSVVHNALNTLIEKGFVTFILEGKIKHYRALSPKLIQKYIEAKKKEFTRILPELESLQKENSEATTAKVYKGYKGLYAATLDLLEDTKKGDEYKYFALKESLLTEEALNFFKKVDILKKEYKIKVRGIAENDAKGKLRDYKASKIKFTSWKIPSAMNLCKNKIMFISMTEKPTAVLIRSKEIASKYNQLWDYFWKESE